MKIGIIVYSHTGNTLSVAEKIKNSLSLAGHMVAIERITAVNNDPRSQEGKQLKNAPNISPYDAFLFGAPVWAFSLSPLMKDYISQLPSLHGNKTGCFVTQQFPYAWMGGSHAIRQMQKTCESKGADIFETGVINWSSKKRDVQIQNLIERFLIL